MRMKQMNYHRMNRPTATLNPTKFRDSVRRIIKDELDGLARERVTDYGGWIMNGSNTAQEKKVVCPLLRPYYLPPEREKKVVCPLFSAVPYFRAYFPRSLST